MNNKKYKLLIVFVTVFLVFVYLFMFHKWDVKVTIQGIENGFVDIDVEYVSGLYTNDDDLDVLFNQWENREVKYGDTIKKDDVVAVFKKTQDNHTSDYYCIVMEPKEFVGYFDRGIVYDEVNKQYVQFLDKEFKEGTFQPTVEHIHDIQVTFDTRLNVLDYTCIYVRDDLKFLIR